MALNTSWLHHGGSISGDHMVTPKGLFFFFFLNSLAGFAKIVNSTGSVCDQKTSKFLSHRKESMAGHVGAKGIY
jgi:hypothetical protein